MASTKTRPRPTDSAARKFISRIELTEEEARVLVRVAAYHQKTIGPVRFFVQLIAPAEIKEKYRFVKEESKLLKEFARTARHTVRQSPEPRESISFTPRTLIAFWGRILASLNTRRSRRKLSQLEIERREASALKLCEAARAIWQKTPQVIEKELSTRRPVEAEWMRQQLKL